MRTRMTYANVAVALAVESATELTAEPAKAAAAAAVTAIDTDTIGRTDPFDEHCGMEL